MFSARVNMRHRAKHGVLASLHSLSFNISLVADSIVLSLSWKYYLPKEHFQEHFVVGDTPHSLLEIS